MKTKKTEQILSQNGDHAKVAAYAIQVSRLADEEGGGFQALYPPLARSIVGYGGTPAEAVTDLEGLVPSFLDFMVQSEQTLPEAPVEKEWDEFSGKFNVRVPRVLHAQLVELAEDQGVSLNSLIQTVLTSGATALAAGRMFGAVERVAASPAKALRSSWDVEAAKAPRSQDLDLTKMFARERTQDDWQMAQGE